MQYRVSDADPYKLKFSLIVGIPVTDTASIPEDMKTFKIPPHRYVKYLTKVNLNMKDMIDNELPIIGYISKRYKTSKFVQLECYHDSEVPFVENFMPIDS